MQGHVWATKVLGLKFPPSTLEHRLDCARHDRAAADPEDREASIPKILVPSVITKEHETVRSDQQFPINLLTHLFGPAPHHYASARRLSSVIRICATSIVRPPPASNHALGCCGRESSAHEIDHLCDGEAMREHDRLGAAVARRGQQLERAAAVGPGAVAQMAKRGERGIGEREHARVYPNARSDAAAASKTNARVGLQWCHSLRKSVCCSMCAGSAYWCHLSAKSSVISTNGTIRSESTRQLACPRLSLPPFANAAIAASRVGS